MFAISLRLISLTQTHTFLFNFNMKYQTRTRLEDQKIILSACACKQVGAQTEHDHRRMGANRGNKAALCSALETADNSAFDPRPVK